MKEWKIIINNTECPHRIFLNLPHFGIQACCRICLNDYSTIGFSYPTTACIEVGCPLKQPEKTNGNERNDNIINNKIEHINDKIDLLRIRITDIGRNITVPEILYNNQKIADIDRSIIDNIKNINNINNKVNLLRDIINDKNKSFKKITDDINKLFDAIKENIKTIKEDMKTNIDTINRRIRMLEEITKKE